MCVFLELHIADDDAGLADGAALGAHRVGAGAVALDVVGAAVVALQGGHLHTTRGSWDLPMNYKSPSCLKNNLKSSLHAPPRMRWRDSIPSLSEKSWVVIYDDTEPLLYRLQFQCFVCPVSTVTHSHGL